MQTKTEKRLKVLKKLEKEYEYERELDPLSYRTIMLRGQINNLNKKLFSKNN